MEGFFEDSRWTWNAPSREKVKPIKGSWLPVKVDGGLKSSGGLSGFSTSGKFDASISSATSGTTGGTTVRMLSHSMPVKKGCALMSLKPDSPEPRRSSCGRMEGGRVRWAVQGWRAAIGSVSQKNAPSAPAACA